jgi:hypothetical protein
MSATNRGSKRIKNDNYPTPTYCVKRLLEAWQPKNNLLLEPCVGDGVIVKVMESKNVFNDNKYKWVTLDIRPDTYFPDRDKHIVQDFLTLEDPANIWEYKSIGTVITNPPFSLLNQFLYHSRKLCPEADLVYLLRLNTLAGGPRSGRDKLYKDLGVPDIYVIPNRPSFTKGKTDACEYAWFIFPPQPRDHGIVKILNQTSAKEKK